MTSTKPVTSSKRQHCRARRKDRSPCHARPGPSGYCFAHGPEAEKARRKGGQNKANAARLGKLVPPRLMDVYDKLETALEEVHTGALEPKVGSAMAVLAGAMVRVLTSGELEERVRRLEGRGDGRSG